MKCDVCGKSINQQHPPVTAWINKVEYHACEKCNGDGSFTQLLEDKWDAIHTTDYNQ